MLSAELTTVHYTHCNCGCGVPTCTMAAGCIS